MTWTRSSTTELSAVRSVLWDLLSDLTSWPTWDPDLTSVRIDGPVAAGATGALVPSGRIRGAAHAAKAGPFTVTTYEPGERIAVRQPVSAGHLDLTFELAARPGGRTAFTQTVAVTGPLTWLVVLVIGADLARHFPDKCARLESMLHNRDIHS